MERNGESWKREIRTLGLGVNDFHAKINTRTSCGVRVGRVVEGVAMEEAVVVGVGSAVGAAVPVVLGVGIEAAAAVASAAVALFIFFAIFKICWSSKIFLEVVRVLGLVEVVLVEGGIGQYWS